MSFIGDTNIVLQKPFLDFVVLDAFYQKPNTENPGAACDLDVCMWALSYA